MLKNKTIVTDKATLLVIEFPEHYSVYRRVNGTVFCSNVRNKSPKIVWDSFRGNWLLIERMPDITEEQASDIVDKIEFASGNVYKDYETNMGLNSPIKSLLSLLTGHGIYFENSLGREPDSKDDFYRDALGITSNYWSDLLEWQKAQSKVCDKERTYLFIKEE